jgi:hypothetical protein
VVWRSLVGCSALARLSFDVPVEVPFAELLLRRLVALTPKHHAGSIMAAAKNKAVFGIYATADQAERAVNALIEDGFLSEDVSVLMPDQRSTREFAHHKDTKAPEGTTAGVTAGGVVGGALGVLVGLGALAIPGLGPLLAAGPIVAGLAGLGAGGAVGGLIGALVGMGIPEYEARRYEGRVKDGGTLLSVHCDTAGDILRAREILTDTGAVDIASSTESSGVESNPAPPVRPAETGVGRANVSGTK